MHTKACHSEVRKELTIRCYICNRVIDEPQYNQEHQDYDPCPSCEAVIDDLLASYEDQPAAPDDPTDIVNDPFLEGLYPQSYDPFDTESS